MIQTSNVKLSNEKYSVRYFYDLEIEDVIILDLDLVKPKRSTSFVNDKTISKITDKIYERHSYFISPS